MRSLAEARASASGSSPANLHTASSASARIRSAPRRHRAARTITDHASVAGSSGRAGSYCQRSTASAHRSASTGFPISAEKNEASTAVIGCPSIPPRSSSHPNHRRPEPGPDSLTGRGYRGSLEARCWSPDRRASPVQRSSVRPRDRATSGLRPFIRSRIRPDSCPPKVTSRGAIRQTSPGPKYAGSLVIARPRPPRLAKGQPRLFHPFGTMLRLAARSEIDNAGSEDRSQIAAIPTT